MHKKITSSAAPDQSCSDSAGTGPHAPGRNAECKTVARIWDRRDAWVVALTVLASAGVYFWTAAPNVTLLDSGEFVVAAQHFGVPHPTGYPLWTLLAWLFQLLPLGNAAWEINLFSGFCGAIATGLLAWLFCSSTGWMLAERAAGREDAIALAGGVAALLFAFSFSMWSQAVIAEVYTLHALLIGLYLAALYIWLRNPGSLRWLLAAFFILALSFSNHQLSIAMAPLPLLAVLLVRRDLFWDLVAAGLLTVLLAYLGFAILSEEVPVLKTAIRFFYCGAAAFVVFAVVRRRRIDWRLPAFLPVAVALGLLPYAYMPVASSTNPPMNWAYTRTPEGFFFSFNRSQYGGSLSQQSLRSLGRLVGTAPTASVPSSPARAALAGAQEWISFFWWQLGRSFSPLGIVASFAALLLVLRLKDVAARTWVYLLEIGFVLAAILQPVADGATTDAGGWWLQMPYHTYTNFLFASLVGLGLFAGVVWWQRRFPRFAWMRWSLALLPLWPLWFNVDGCSQRGRWFGWEFGHEMLKDLPAGSVVLGGTDPGRFVPTYMILGESTQLPALKRDPDFDRRDLFIITQNGVGESLYRRYLRDQYSAGRPAARNAFEKWLGRDSAYPRDTLDFPGEEEIEQAIETEAQRIQAAGEVPNPSLPHSIVTKMIWEKNRDRRAFFVEESFPLEWSYPHAEPHGLIYQIHPEPLESLDPKVVEADFEFWNKTIQRLRSNPDYARDYDAKRSFSKLRATSGNLYAHRKMDAEAERAYRQALELWEGNGESLNALTGMLWDREDFNGVLALLQPAVEADPNNLGLWQLVFLAEKRKELQGEIAQSRQALADNPDNESAVRELLGLYHTVGETNQIAGLLKSEIPRFAGNADFLRSAIDWARQIDQPNLAALAARSLVMADPGDFEACLILAGEANRSGDAAEALRQVRLALEKGGLPAREQLRKNPGYEALRATPEVAGLLER